MRHLAETGQEVPMPLPALASRRQPGSTWIDVLALHLEARRNWRELAETTGDGEDAPNEVDVFLIGIIARFAGVRRVLVASAELARRLDHCRVDPAFVFVAAMDEAPSHGAISGEVWLYPVTAIEQAERAAAVGAVVLVYGVGRDWQPPLASAGLDSVRRRPLAGLSPALWKSSLLLLAADRACAERDRLLEQATTLLADRAIDPFFLLDQIQELRAAARRPEAAPDDVDALKTHVAELELEVSRLRRYALMQQESLARLGAAEHP